MNKTRTIPHDIRDIRHRTRTYKRIPKGWRALRYNTPLRRGDRIWIYGRWEPWVGLYDRVCCGHFIRRVTARSATPHQPK